MFPIRTQRPGCHMATPPQSSRHREAANYLRSAPAASAVAAAATAKVHLPSTFLGEALQEYGVLAERGAGGPSSSPSGTFSLQSCSAAPPVVDCVVEGAYLEDNTGAGACSGSRGTRRPRCQATGRGGKRTTTLPFHMLPFEVQAHLLQQQAEVKGEQLSTSAAKWFPLRPPALQAAVAPSATFESCSSSTPRDANARPTVTATRIPGVPVQGGGDFREVAPVLDGSRCEGGGGAGMTTNLGSLASGQLGAGMMELRGRAATEFTACPDVFSSANEQGHKASDTR